MIILGGGEIEEQIRATVAEARARTTAAEVFVPVPASWIDSVFRSAKGVAQSAERQQAELQRLHEHIRRLEARIETMHTKIAEHFDPEFAGSFDVEDN